MTQEDLQSLHDQILHCQEKIHRKEQLRQELGRMEKELGQKRKLYFRLFDRMKKEQADFENLSGLSLASLYHLLLRTKEEKLQKEEQEYIEAKIKVEECQSQIKELRKEIDVLGQEMLSLFHAENELEALIQKRNQIARQNSNRDDPLLSLSEQLASAQARLQNLKREAETARCAVESLQKAADQVQSAADWGSYDMALGGPLASIYKHDKLEEVRFHVQGAQRHLKNLLRMRPDLSLRFTVNSDLGSMKWMDVFLDGFFVDWAVQDKIHEMCDQVACVRREAESLLHRLNWEYLECEKNFKETYRLRTDFLKNQKG